MSFTSLAFLAFFLIVWLGYLILPGCARKGWLLAASYLFCASLGGTALLVLILSTLVTWLAGLALESGRERTGLPARGIFAAVIAFHVIALGFFKYNSLGILLPVGISFYTFQAIGYLADVHGGNAEAERNLLNFALFQAFVPKLIQGPIERSGNLLAQIRKLPEREARELLDLERVRNGGLLILWGLCEKLLIADRIAVPVNAVYSQFGAFGGVEIVLTTVLYAFQIYCDFAGYTDIARGTAQLLGFDLLANFRRPYLADSVQDFWRRWHQSLSSWLRDYLYIPLGGSRKGRLRRAVNILLTFLVSGVWHGTGFHFLAWGGLHGLALLGVCRQDTVLILIAEWDAAVSHWGITSFSSSPHFNLKSSSVLPMGTIFSTSWSNRSMSNSQGISGRAARWSCSSLSLSMVSNALLPWMAWMRWSVSFFRWEARASLCSRKSASSIKPLLWSRWRVWAFSFKSARAVFSS